MICCMILGIIGAGLYSGLRVLFPNFLLPGNGATAWRAGGAPLSDQRARFSWASRLRSFSFAGEGLSFVVKNEHNAWIHLVAALIVLLLGALLPITINDWRWLIGVIALVWMAEIFNTAIEHLCNVVSPERNPSVKIAKDVAAGAVLICAMAALLIGLTIFFPYILP